MNLTEGGIVRNIVVFSVPFLLSYFLQTLYGMADLFIVGQFNGADVISAVSIGSQIMHMFTVIIVGLAMGTSVLIGQATGAKNKTRVFKIIGNTFSFFFVLSLFLTALLFILSSKIVSLVSTPKESVSETIIYLKICFLGIPFIVFYNVIASIFRGKGDSKTPMYFVAVACVLNILLDFLLVGKFGMKAAGAALATIISQAVSVILGMSALFAKKGVDAEFEAGALKSGVRESEVSEDLSNRGVGEPEGVSRQDFKIDGGILGRILKIGFPVAAEDGFVQVSFMVITIIANRRGVDVAAAVGIVEKIITFLFLIPSAMLSSISSIAAQNIGAAKPERATKTLWVGTVMAAALGLFFAVVLQFAARPLITLFTREEAVVLLGVQYLRSYVFDCFFAAVHFCFSGYFCAVGKSIICFIHNSISIIFIRIPGAYFASKMWPQTLYPMGWAAPLGSLLSAIICVLVFFYLQSRKL